MSDEPPGLVVDGEVPGESEVSRLNDAPNHEQKTLEREQTEPDPSDSLDANPPTPRRSHR